MKSIAPLIILILLLFLSCSTRKKQPPPSFTPEVVEAHGYVVPDDSIEKPKVIPAGKPTVVHVGKPKVVLTNTDTHPVGTPQIVKAGRPRECIPGNEGFTLPKIADAIDSTYIAGIPEVGMADEFYISDRNPKNFRSFGKLQGLKNDIINCFIQDKYGNLWFGTNGGGMTKYDGKRFSHFTEKEGLTNNFINSIHEDSKGNLWFGMGIGIIKYDGTNFTHLTEKEGFIDKPVVSILEDKTGKLWFATEGGVCKYDGRTFTRFTKEEGLIDNNVSDILEDTSGKIWFATRGGVSKYDNKSFTNFTESDGLINNNVSSILKDKSGHLWFATSGGVSKYDGKRFTNLTKNEGLPGNDIKSIEEDKSGNLWFGIWGSGVCKFDGNVFTHFTEQAGLSDNYVLDILEDTSRNLWFATKGGLSFYNAESFTNFSEREGLTDRHVMSILQDRNGIIWFGTSDNGVNRFDGKSFTHFTTNEGLINNSIWSIMEDTTGNIWFGSYEGAIKYDGMRFTYFTEKEGLINNDVKCILEDRFGNIWFGTAGGASKYDGKSFTQYTKKEGLSSNNVMDIKEDRSGNLWFCGYNGGVTRYDRKNFTHFTKKAGIRHNNVRNILEDDYGNIWFGTLGGGISKYDGKTITNFGEKEGLSNDYILSTMKDKKGNLWFGTSAGLNKIEKNKLSQSTDADAISESEHFFKSYTYEEGFSGIGVNVGRTIYETNDGTIWIGADENLTAFNPGDKKSDSIAPNIQLTDLKLFNEDIAWQNLRSPSAKGKRNNELEDTSLVLGNGVLLHDFSFDGVSKWYGVPDHLSLAYDNNYLTFQFVGITLKSPKKVKYQYKLEGLEQSWSTLSNQGEANYGNLPHGKFTFKVKAKSGDGYWSNEYHYTFTIRPPWWRTWWAYTLFALSSAGIIYSIFSYRLNKIRMKHQLALQQHKVTELEMQTLRSQMNPHFIFNSLNSINLFILENNKLQASEYLSKFSRLVRLILNNSQEAFIPLEQDLEALELYLELESLRFEQKFSYKIEVDSDIDTSVLKVPPLLIQPYAENAIWHGLMNKKDKGHLEILVYREKDTLFCKISDDGVGRKKAALIKNKSSSPRKSVGMHITAQRIAMFQDQEESNTYVSITDLVLPDGNAGGTEVLITIPFIS